MWKSVSVAASVVPPLLYTNVKHFQAFLSILHKCSIMAAPDGALCGKGNPLLYNYKLIILRLYIQYIMFFDLK